MNVSLQTSSNMLKIVFQNVFKFVHLSDLPIMSGGVSTWFYVLQFNPFSITYYLEQIIPHKHVFTLQSISCSPQQRNYLK